MSEGIHGWVKEFYEWSSEWTNEWRNEWTIVLKTQINVLIHSLTHSINNPPIYSHLDYESQFSYLICNSFACLLFRISLECCFTTNNIEFKILSKGEINHFREVKDKYPNFPLKHTLAKIFQCFDIHHTT